MGASASLQVFHSMLPVSGMAGLSLAMRPRVSAISGARNRLSELGHACHGSEADAAPLLHRSQKAPFSANAADGVQRLTIDRALQNVLAVS